MGRVRSSSQGVPGRPGQGKGQETVKLGMFIDPDNLAFLEMMRDDVGMDMEMLLTTAVEIGCGIMREEIAAITARRSRATRPISGV